MIHAPPASHRDFKSVRIDCDLAVVGGGLAGTCCAITAARAGIRVTLIQDRPVLGGNCSSEVRMWVVGATSHMGNNNRWAREGGVVDEILVENTYRNTEGNPVLLDPILLEKVRNEPNITLLLNTAVFDLDKSDPDTIDSVRAFCSQNSTVYEVHAPLFCDASGDGVVGYLAGAAFRIGAESREEFGEKFAPDEAYGSLLGHSLYFYTTDTGKPVKFVPPAYALSQEEIKKIARYRRLDLKTHGSYLWWIEYGGRLDTVHETEDIKWELWRVVYGMWDYFKNSGEFPEAETMTLSWVQKIPGKRESRRFEGDAILTQQDVVEGRQHADAVSYGGWALDLHPADGVYSDKPGCDQWHAKGVYQIPYRCMYSRNINNLFLTGRLISVSHVAFGSTRVMATCANNGQAVGMAAAICRSQDVLPAQLAEPGRIGTLQRDLMRAGQHIPGLTLDDEADLARRARISCSSDFRLEHLAADGPILPLSDAWAMLVPLNPGPVPAVSFQMNVAEPTELRVELRTCSRQGQFTPDVLLATCDIAVENGEDQTVRVDFATNVEAHCYAFICLMPNAKISVRCSEQRLTAVLAVINHVETKVARSTVQDPPGDIGIERFAFWRPVKRPGGHNLAVSFDPPIEAFGPDNVVNGIARPTDKPNGWVADLRDPTPRLQLSWEQQQTISRIELVFDTDFDHPMECFLMGQHESVMPFCVRNYRILDGSGNVAAEVRDNYQTRNTHRFEEPIETAGLTIELAHPGNGVPAALFEIRCYDESDMPIGRA